MKKVSLALALVLLFGSVMSALSGCDINENTDIPKPGDVPIVYITVKGDVLFDDYIKCEIKVIEDKNRLHPEISDNNCEIKIRGNSTAYGEKKPYNIKFSGKTNVLGMGKNKKWCLLANCFDKTLLRNALALDMAAGVGMTYTPSYRFVDVYLNGEYLGNYMLTDAVEASDTRVNINTARNEFLIERDDREDSGKAYIETPVFGIRFGINAPEALSSDQTQWLEAFLGNSENSLLSGNFDDVNKYFDIESMIDLYILKEYFKDIDFDFSSTRFYIKNGKIHGGPVWDFDLSAGICDNDYYPEYNNMETSCESYEGIWCDRLAWYAVLFAIPEVETMLRERYALYQDLIVNLYEDNSLGKNRIDDFLDKYGESFERNYSETRWLLTEKYSIYERTPDSTFEENIEYLREWLKKRNNWLLEYYS